jgi:carbonic anhydrase/acetyltransferase-like protein (isoleucine patch superfamily)
MKAVVRSFANVSPRLGTNVYLAETAVVVGDVELGADASVWFGSVLRGDVGWIRVGARSNIQDLCMLHMSLARSNTEIGEEVTIGHGVIIHGARIGSGALVGMGAILLDNAVIGEEALVGAGSVVPAGMQVPPRTLVMGSPARIVRELGPTEWTQGRMLAARYVEVARGHHAAAHDARL